MSNERSQPGFFGRIARFIRGDANRTPMHSEAMNQIVDLLNALLASKGTNGIRVVPSMAGFTFELDDDTKKQIGRLPAVAPDGGVTPGNGTFKFRGEWDPTVDYEINDIMIYRSSAALTDGLKAGTYVAIVPNKNVEPFEAAVGAQTTWRTVAKGAWTNLRVRDAANSAALDIGDGEFASRETIGGVSTQNFFALKSWELYGLDTTALGVARGEIHVDTGTIAVGDPGLYAVDLVGGASVTLRVQPLRTITMREIQYKDENGNTQKRMFLASEIYA